MNISNETLDILRNFSSINSGLTVKEGNELKTVSAMKNIYAKAIVTESFDKEHVKPYIKRNFCCEYLANNYWAQEENKNFSIDSLEDYVRVFNLMSAHKKENLYKSFKDFI